MRKQIPFIRKEAFPGGVNDMIDRKPKGVQSSGPFLDKGKNIDLGDILSFNYIGREIIDGEIENTGAEVTPNNKVVLNPLVIFAGYDVSSQCIMGVDLKRFLLEKQVTGLAETLRLLRKFYYYLEEDNSIQVWRKRAFTEVPYNGPLSFRYDNFSGAWGSVGRLLTRYFKSYKPNLMREISVLPPDIAEIECKGTVRVLPGKLK
jgi:hypothetical protein